MKKVIFVQGTRYSGSTFFHMQLATDPHGFACGEVHSLFQPYVATHVNRDCTCGYEKCRIWPRVLGYRASELYRGIFELCPEVNFIVDSSKQPFWIDFQENNLRKQGIEFSNILIWKSPLEFAGSMKRKKKAGWKRAWLQSHLLYFSTLSGIRSVKYRDLVTNDQALRLVCERIGIDYFPGKEKYWAKQHCVLGGSNTAKYHVLDGARSEEHRSRSSAMNKEIGHRKIEYVPVSDVALQNEVQGVLDANPQYGNLIRLLEYCDVSNDEYDESVYRKMVRDVELPRLTVELKRLKYHYRTAMGRFKYRNAPRFKEQVVA